MRKVMVAVVVALLAAATGAVAAQISGNYIEARTADVFVGPCFANSEAGLAGQEAVLGWQVKEGNFNGVPLAGLSVVGVVHANSTLGDPFHNPYPAKAVVVVDQRATPEQARALVSFVRSNAPELFGNIVHVEKAPIEFAVNKPYQGAGDGHESHGAAASLVVGDLARIVTRGLTEHDKVCANEELYYPPLTPGTETHPAFATSHEFKGDGLGTVWSVSDRASAFVGTFSR